MREVISTSYLIDSSSIKRKYWKAAWSTIISYNVRDTEQLHSWSDICETHVKLS